MLTHTIRPRAHGDSGRDYVVTNATDFWLADHPRARAARRSRARRGAVVLCLALLGLAAAATAALPAWYTVRRGDSLSRISQRLGVRLEDLRRDNGLVGSRIHPGQRLRLSQPLRGLRERDLRWRRPFAGEPGRRLRGYGPRATAAGMRVTHTGIDISLPQGSEVRAPATGVVRYCGPQEGFGTVVIIEHGAGWSSVLAPLAPDTSRVRPGEVVLGGDFLGRTAAPAEGPEPCLHVELRHHGDTADPSRLLR